MLNADDTDETAQAILDYLQKQQDVGQGEYWFDSFGMKTCRSILDEILQRIDDRARLKEAFLTAIQAHNQIDLFNLEEFIPNFIIDDEHYHSMTFRETLVISSFVNDEDAAVPTPVGGLCLDVQKATGKGPLVRKDPKFDERFYEAYTWKHEEGNAKNLGKWQRACKKCKENLSDAKVKSTKPRKKCPESVNEERSQESMKIPPTASQLELLEYKLGIENSLRRTQCKFLVHVSSQFYVDGKNAGSLLTSWVDKNLHTLEEKRTEFIVESDGTIKEKMLYVAMQKGRYFVKIHSTADDLIEKRFYSFRKTKYFIGEGANYVLMRYLAIWKFAGQIELSTMYIDGSMCRNIYKCTGPEGGIVNNTKLDVCKIYRTIIEECGITHNSVTVLTLQGQIVKHEWENCDHILQVNPFAQVKNEKPGKLEKIYLKHVWENDMELFSKYLDKKESHKLKLKQYLKDHQEVRNILADYVEKILEMKPHDVLDFTFQYFKQYKPINLPRTRYFEDNEEETESVKHEDSKDSTIDAIDEGGKEVEEDEEETEPKIEGKEEDAAGIATTLKYLSEMSDEHEEGVNCFDNISGTSIPSYLYFYLDQCTVAKSENLEETD